LDVTPFSKEAWVSNEARLMVRPFRVYATWARGEQALPRVVHGLLVWTFVYGAFVSFGAAGRLVPFHLASTALFASFVPAIQAVAIFTALSVAAPESRGPRLAWHRVLGLYLAGHGPWLLLFLAISGTFLFARDARVLFVILPVLVPITIAWGVVLTFACFRSGVGLSGARALFATLVFYGSATVLVLGFYLAFGQLAPLFQS
jgi:hypothetical protein